MRRVLSSLAHLAAGAALATACSPAGGAPSPAPTGSTGDPAPTARARLAAHAAATEDLVGLFVYRLAAPDRADRTVRVVRAADGGWRVDVPGGALGGAADIAVVHTGRGLHQCVIGGASPRCVRAGRIDDVVDPPVPHVFTDWPAVLTDRAAPLAVADTERLPETGGSCFAVESSTASLLAPLDTGIYCYGDDGVLTGARLSFGTLTLTDSDRDGPASIDLPGPVVEAPPLPTASPDPPAATTSQEGSPAQP